MVPNLLFKYVCYRWCSAQPGVRQEHEWTVTQTSSICCLHDESSSNVNTKEVPRKGKEHASHAQITSLYEVRIQQYAVLCLGLLAVNCSRGNGMKPQWSCKEEIWWWNLMSQCTIPGEARGFELLLNLGSKMLRQGPIPGCSWDQSCRSGWTGLASIPSLHCRPRSAISQGQVWWRVLLELGVASDLAPLFPPHHATTTSDSGSMRKKTM